MTNRIGDATVNKKQTFMKKLLFISVVASTLLTGCATTLLTQSNVLRCNETNPVVVTDIMADLEVSPKKATFFYIPSMAVNRAGSKNVLETAVREALIANGNADVFVQLDKQMKLNSRGQIESITISGYPAKYVNFRSLDEQYILKLVKMYEDLNLKLYEKVAPEVTVPNLIPNVIPAETPKKSKKKIPFLNIGK